MTVKISLGRAIGETTRLIGKLHRRALAEFDADFPLWMLLTLLEEEGPRPAAEVVKELDRRLDLAEPAAVRLLERAAAAGHVTGGDTAALTEAGKEYFAALYAHARKATDAAFDGIDPEALDIALTVVLAARDRATAELA